MHEHVLLDSDRQAEEELRLTGAFRDEEPVYETEDVILESPAFRDDTAPTNKKYPELTEEEMEESVRSYTKEYRNNVSAVWDTKWLAHYADKVNWSIVCEEIKNLTEEFLKRFYSKIDFKSLSKNEYVKLSLDFMEENLDRFDLSKPVPCLIRVLSTDFALKHRDKINLDEKSFFQFCHGPADEQDQIGEMFIPNYDIIKPF